MSIIYFCLFIFSVVFFYWLSEGRWIVSVDWVQHSLRKGVLLREEEYEVYSNGKASIPDAPRRARLSMWQKVLPMWLLCLSQFLLLFSHLLARDEKYAAVQRNLIEITDFCFSFIGKRVILGIRCPFGRTICVTGSVEVGYIISVGSWRCCNMYESEWMFALLPC